MTEGITMLKLREAAALDLLRYKNGPQPVDLRSMADAQTVPSSTGTRNKVFTHGSRCQRRRPYDIMHGAQVGKPE